MTALAISPERITSAIAAALAAGSLAYGGFWLLGRPSALSDRLTQIDQQASEAQRMAANARKSSTDPAGAVCEGPADVAGDKLRRSLAASATTDGVAITTVDVSPQARDEANAGLQVVRLSVEASGQYFSVVNFLTGLSKAAPSVFVDTLDITRSWGGVTLQLSGRFYCLPAGH